MARTTYTVDNVAKTPTGTAVNLRTGDNVNGHYIPNSGATKLLLQNTAGAPAKVWFYPGGHPGGTTGAVTAVDTAVGALTVSGSPVQVLPVNLAANENRLCGPFPQGVYGSVLYFDPSAATVKFVAFED